MNAFLQQMLNGNNGRGKKETAMKQQTEFSPHCETNRMKSAISPATRSKSFPVLPENTLRKSSPIPIQRPATFHTRETAQDFDGIIWGSEENCLSSLQQNLQNEEKTEKFVKRMVAMFEQKCINIKSEIELGQFRKSTPLVFEQCQQFHGEYSENSGDSPSVSCKVDNTVDLSSWSFTMDEELSDVSDESQKEKNPPAGETSNSTPRRDKLNTTDEFTTNWIPTMEKKLARKHFFQKLLSMLARRKSANRGVKLLSCQLLNNLNEETAENCDILSSRSSRTSMASDAVFYQKNCIVGSSRRRKHSSTFQPTAASVDATESEFFSDLSQHGKKIIFEDIPRSEVRLSLGPSFPLEIVKVQTSLSSLSTVVSFGDEYESAPVASWKSHQANATLHEVPSAYASKSAPELFNAPYASSSLDYPVSNVPNVKIPPLLRRMKTSDFGALTGVNCASPYGFHSDEKPHFATIKPRSRRTLPSADLLS